ncbi:MULTISPECIES: acyl-ACP--UDP-N-acetylglucosamine O-acyltransferase [Epilithonimonas]|jgi:UDP-N-acetylglucosamine acyltransferase|uniref:Acyl-ACP--UDP-N-acetylglucosamine O-acyltransferase n=2 Tax=Epilithonimonas TaxID=2782229 RepID=A0A3G8Y6A3_9FLAO|nr:MULTISPECIES: acyl-ACP--UDP-N-acetylglucosamine O-acyltransferase [Epilithonimonas]HAP96467.1 acyl-ACP--UDP-N-acetylglucosamine O-acyltransferase [Chryseobacterium sp.]AZI40815.1 acyl-ACP--UDP-N-acetylglucosamine O-acyltransferase [Epilithonimonas vandammei]AZI54511.1 acyl-ACP--UDP-N-acetylglucosamine O-acyltransferase [Epilithonimonas vandammei]ROI13710.1 acyl-ACP--UDP-N-acetylglucosamine O-acyltransferase [Epilithonimonas hominis]SEH55374.1 acyl-[acyl-carrier-protein]--UDP-N-acetylglucosa
MIHQLTAVDPRAKIGKNVTVEPFTTIASDVVIGAGTWIGSNVTIMDGARIGKNCKIFPGTVISAIPQDLKFDGEDTQTIIGDNTTLRECVTINRGTKALGYTKVGNDCLIMATSHVAHDCVLGNNVIIANGCGIAGHVEIGDFVVMGGLSAVQQFGKIGKHVMISGGSLIRKDIPPYVKVAREPISYAGINSVGLRRRGFTNDKIFEIQKIYRAIFQMKMNTTQAIEYIEKEMLPTMERDEIITFIQNSPRGIVKGYGSTKE